MRQRDLPLILALGLAASGAGFLIQACSDSTGGGGSSLQSQCVADQLNLERNIPNGQDCSNFGYSDCDGFASECVGSCGFDMCQSSECSSDAQCESGFGSAFECADYVISSVSYGSWCKLSDCPKGTLGCPCATGNVCGADPYGSGSMSCVSNVCESSCPYSCREGTSTCCGGAFCGGNCIGSPCC
jgi:hypothetical protein